MKSIFDYADFRLFLRDYLVWRKEENKPLTYEELGERVGFNSKGFVTQILQAKSKIPKNLIQKFSEALELSKKEGEYFIALVQFNQAKSHQKKNELFEELTSKFRHKISSIGPDKFDFYKKWYYSAIRSLLGYYPFKDDFDALGKQLNPTISPAQAKKAVNLLVKLEMLKMGEDGFYHLTHRMITGGHEVESLAIINFQQETINLAKEAFERFPNTQRNSSTLTLAMSDEGYDIAVKKIAALRKELMDIVRFDKGVNKVVQFNLHVFPLTHFKKSKS